MVVLLTPIGIAFWWRARERTSLATVSGGVLAAYVGMLSPYLPDVGGHLIAASVTAAVAGMLI